MRCSAKNAQPKSTKSIDLYYSTPSPFTYLLFRSISFSRRPLSLCLLSSILSLGLQAFLPPSFSFPAFPFFLPIFLPFLSDYTFPALFTAFLFYAFHLFSFHRDIDRRPFSPSCPFLFLSFLHIYFIIFLPSAFPFSASGPHQAKPPNRKTGGKGRFHCPGVTGRPGRQGQGENREDTTDRIE